MDTTQLVNRCRAGDSLAIESLVATYKPLVYRLAISILDDPAEADEATQDALVTVLDKLASFRGEASFTTWLYTITLNVCRGRLRKRRTQTRLISILQSWFWLKRDDDPHPEQQTLARESDTGKSLPNCQSSVRIWSNIPLIKSVH